AQFFEDYLHAVSDGGEVSPAGATTFSAPPCNYIGGIAATDTLAVNQDFADEIGADAQAETLYAWQWLPVPVPVAIQFASPAREHVLLGFDFTDVTAAAQRQALLGRILSWFSGPPAPAAIGAVSISASGNNAVLSWATDPSWVCPVFRVYRGTTAYFLPGVVYQEAAASPFIDAGAVGNTAINYFYRVAPVDFDVEGAPSPVVGEFDYEVLYVPSGVGLLDSPGD
ncbi:MAG: hypothetical protein MUE60_10395, partial [Candidatus Eisenbacteria bacterium]|nr:hypothetical protein [Candidatus Eisenbacteria bacterium]